VHGWVVLHGLFSVGKGNHIYYLKKTNVDRIPRVNGLVRGFVELL